MPRNRAERRINDRRAKRRSLAIMTMNPFSTWKPTERQVGRWASTRNRPCSCAGCKRGPRLDRSRPILATDLHDPQELEAERLQALEDAAWDEWAEQELGWEDDPAERYYREDQEDQFAGYSWDDYRADVEDFGYEY